MERTYAAIALTLAICVMAIPAAYLMGQRSALEIARRQYEESLARARVAQLTPAAPNPSEPTLNSPQVLPADTRIARLNRASVESPSPDAMRMAQSPAASEPSPSDVTRGPSTDTAESPDAETSFLTPIPQSAFDAAAVGTTYDEVVREFGREGEPMMTLEDAAGTITTQYAWDWLDTEGKVARVQMQFVDGRLMDKSISE